MIRLAVTCGLFGVASATAAPSLSAKDLGIFYGEPTPSFALFYAQYPFAAEACTAAGLVAPSETMEKMVKHAINFSKHHFKKDPELAQLRDRYAASYAAAWDQAAADTRRAFCDALQADVAMYARVTWRASPFGFYNLHLSPMSDAAKKRQRMIAGGLSLVGAAAATAGSVAASNDGLAAAKAGDFTQGAQLAGEAQDINAIGTALAATSQPEGGPPAFPPVTDGADGVVRPCPVSEHFAQVDAPGDSSFWTTYQPVTIQCRNPEVVPGAYWNVPAEQALRKES